MNANSVRFAWLLPAALMVAAALREAPAAAPARDPFLAQLAGHWEMVAKVPGKADWHQRG